MKLLYHQNLMKMLKNFQQQKKEGSLKPWTSSGKQISDSEVLNEVLNSSHQCHSHNFTNSKHGGENKIYTLSHISLMMFTL